MHANAGCGAPVGITIQGTETLRVTGDVQSNGILRLWWLDIAGGITGVGKSPCPLNPQVPNAFPASGGYSNAPGPYPDPFATVNFALVSCLSVRDQPRSASEHPGPNWVVGAGVGGADLLQPAGVYCGDAGGININSPWSPDIDTTGSTFLTTGPMTIGAAGNITMSAAAGSPNNIIAYTTAVGGINMGFGAGYTVNGSFYAPLGLINAGGGSGPLGFTMTGRLVANEINIGLPAATASPGWMLTAPGGGGGGGWALVQ